MALGLAAPSGRPPQSWASRDAGLKSTLRSDMVGTHAVNACWLASKLWLEYSNAAKKNNLSLFRLKLVNGIGNGPPNWPPGKRYRPAGRDWRRRLSYQSLVFRSVSRAAM